MAEAALLADVRRLRILAKLREQSVVRVRDLAEEFKTSQMTIRRDLAAMASEGLLRQVHGGAVLRERVDESQTASEGLGHLGIVVPTADYYFAPIITGCRETIADAGGTASVLVSDFDMVRERVLCEQFVATGANALVYAPTFTQETAADVSSWLFDLPIPVVLLERDIADPLTGRAWSSVRTAYEKGWETSLRHLRALGHRRVALVTHGLRQVGVNLAQSWQQAAADAGYEREALLFADPRATSSPAQDVLDEIVDWIASAGVTGVISHCDQATLAIVQTIRARGLRIPEDLSIITNEDQIAQMTEPPLTSNSPMKLAVGRTAGRIAHDLMTDTTASIQHVLIQPNLTDRGSCGAPSQGHGAAAKR